MKYQKTLKIPIHYALTKTKLDKLNKLTGRLTYAIGLISNLLNEQTKLDRPTLRKLVKQVNISSKTRLSAGFIDQCIDKVLWSWRSYKKLHQDWERKVEYAEKKSKEKWLEKLLKREPFLPNFNQKTSCRIDYRTGRIEWNKRSKLTKLWMHLSTLKKEKPIDIPLNPSRYEPNQLKDSELDDFELIKKGKKYYAHLSITKQIEDKPIKSVGGVDQGLNHPIAIVLLSRPMPYEGFIGNAEKEEKLEKFEHIIGELKRAKKFKKLRKLRNKSKNIAINYDWQIANKVAELSQGCLLGIGDSDFRKTQFRGNGMPKLRKRIGKWSYSRQRGFITLKRAELGYQTPPINEHGTSQQCYRCGSKIVKRKWLPTGESYILCWDCGLKKDSDISSAYLIALRCMDKLLKVQMNWPENLVSVQDGCPLFY
jgi:transposase